MTETPDTHPTPDPVDEPPTLVDYEIRTGYADTNAETTDVTTRLDP